MADIMTVLGPLDAGSVTAPVLAHEHLAINLCTDDDAEAYLNHADSISTELLELHQAGRLGLVVDQTCRGMGRSPHQLEDISTSSGVPVVAATGWYYERFHPENEPGDDIGHATAVLENDIEYGLDGTHIRPGVLGEIGTHGETPTPHEELSLRASARAATRHQLPLATHAHLSMGIHAQLSILETENIDMTRVVIGHQDLSTTTDQHLVIIAAGAHVGFDTVGKSSYQPDSTRLRLILELLEAGHADRIIVSNDISRHAYLASEGGHGYRHVLTTFDEQLSTHGVDSGIRDQLYRTNALRWLTGGTA